MSTVVFVNAPAYGHINPTLPLVAELVQRGERVFYYTLDTFRSEIEQAGATFCSYGKGFPNHFAQGIEDNPFLKNPFLMIEANLETGKWVVDNLLEEIRDLQPDYIIYDSFCYWGSCLAQILHLPSITSIASIAFNKKITAGGPSQIFLLLGMLWSGWRNLQHSLRLVKEMVEMYRIQPPKFIFEVIRNYSTCNIVYTSKAFQPYGETFDEQQFKFVGPSFLPGQDTSNFPFERLGTQPLIYISLGTIYNKSVSFFRDCIEAFTGSEYQVVMASGNKLNKEALGTIPPNFIIWEYVPQQEILARSVLFITNGGTNSVNQALYNNVPMILVPQSVDHPWNANRVAELGAGKVLSSKHITASLLRSTAEEILTRTSYTKAATEIGATLRAAGGCQRAVDEIFEFKRMNNISDTRAEKASFSI